MPYELAADLVVVAHLLFILYALLGGVLVLRWPATVWLHLPALSWAVLVELAGWGCPLTPLEQGLRHMASTEAYEGGFVEHYIMPLVYPPGLTREMQVAFGAIVATVNVTVYMFVWPRRRRR